MEGRVCWGASGDKPIRLHNETVLVRPQGSPAPAGPQGPAFGLFLVQFTGPLLPAWREELRAQRMVMLRYVSDDAFVARCRGTDLSQVQQLPFVSWVGSYRTEHKVQRDLKDAGGPGLRKPHVAVLFAPDTTPQQLVDAKGLLETIEQEAHPRFGPVLRGRVAPGQWSKLVESETVLWVEPAPVMRLYDESSAKLVAGSGSVRGTYTQELGYDGSGVAVAVADSGLYSGDPDTMHPDLLGRVSRFIPYGNLGDCTDGHGHGTHVAGIIAGGGVIETLDANGNRFGLGVAPGASLVVQRIFDTAGDYVAPNSFAQLISDAWSAGARIGSSSWGEDSHGRYDIAAAEFDDAVRDASGEPGDQGYLLIFSAGNAGPAPGTIGSPAVAKNIIAVGASQSGRSDYSTYREGPDAMADFSSRGPCEDGRVKPDLVAPGTWIASLRSPFGNDRYAWEPIDNDFIFMGGTSQAAPHVAGAAAVFCQYYWQTEGSFPSPALIKAALIHSARDLDDNLGTGPAPNMAEGWGRPDLTELIGSPRAHVFVDQTVALATGQTYETNVIVVSSEEPLRVTMTYTDAAGFPATLPTLVNDLDLEAQGPDGRVYRGNQLAHGVSVPDATGTDAINNVESITVPNPGPGEYRIRVRARNVVEDVCQADGVNQDFALVICGNIPSPNSAVVVLDRAAYTAPGRIEIRLLDAALGAQPSAQVKAFSTTEPLGQAILLLRTQQQGVYTGSVVTARGPAFNDGQLQISDGDSIRVEYVDAVQHQTHSATAMADLLPPNVLEVTVTEQFGHTVVTWQTLDPATSLVRYGTSPNDLSMVVRNDTLTTSHALELTNLVAGLKYYFEVISSDAAGNFSTNDNGGLLFDHLAGSTRTLLLVDDYQFTPGDQFIPLSTYTDALDLCQMSFDVWDPSVNGAYPTYDDLRAYQIVIWRINDSVNAGANNIGRTEQQAIAQYVQSGGSFLMASMQILSRLLNQGDAGFVRDVLHVDRFVPNPDPWQHCLDCDEDFQVETAQGVANDWIGDGLQLGLDYQAYPINDFGLGPDLADTFGPTTNATAFLTEPIAGKTCGLRVPHTGEDSPGRIVFISFPLDALPESAPAPNSRSDVLLRMLQFLVPGLGGHGTVAFHHQRYRLPDVVTVEMADSDLAGQGSAVVNMSSTTVPTPVAVTLRETQRSGLFRGSISLISATNLNAPGQLRALDGDILQVEYEDVSGPRSVISHALVDTNPPAIQHLTVTADYTEAAIEWQTDEPTDALVQFGESAFLGRTAYSPVLDTQHRLTFSGLVPDRGYFFKVTSRDAAGNVTNDDNNGRLFTFDSKPPQPAPYGDNMESGTNGWKVVTVPGSSSGWQWTAPNNGLVSSSHSPDHAWATNPLGDPVTQIDSSLRSPAIELAGGNIATLHFWHAHDFRRQTLFDDREAGQLLLLTNALSAPLLLAEYTGLSAPWQEEVFDLTPHMGRTIFLIWRHELVSFQPTNRPGWALDDVSIVVETRTAGLIQVSNNLAQARVNLDGPSPRIAQGTFTAFANMVPGRYVVTWSPVPFYITPPAQTNTLVSGGLLRLTGLYTFPDVNKNQMSDLWETAFFGAVSPDRTRETDTDADGFTDYAEFVAGTDPTQTNSYLRLTMPSAPPTALRLQVQWPSVPGRAYRLESSSNLINWIPLDNWTQAVSSTTSRSIPITPSARAFFRVGVRQ